MTAIAILFFLGGLCIGSFLNVIVPRLHAGEPWLITIRSRCPHCRHALSARDLIPVISYITLHGKCRYCKKQIHWHYPLVEIVTGCSLAALWFHFGNTIPSSLSLLILWCFYVTILIAVSSYDLRYGEIPDQIMIPSLLVALGALFLPGSPEPLQAVSGALIPLIFFGSLIAISHGAWIGGGDLRLGAFMGLILGWQLTIVALGFAYVSGALIGVALLSSGIKKRSETIPFGPFLAAGTLYAILWGDMIVQWYAGLLGQ